MLAPRHIFFTALEGALLDPDSQSWAGASEALEELQRRRVPLVLAGAGTRAQIEPLRRKIEHGHPFITENGGGLFLPDGYFNVRLEGATRVGRYFCAPFGRAYPEVVAGLEEIASDTSVEAMGFSQMSAREIAQNTNQSPREAELARQREFSEPFFFPGETAPAIARFTEAAAARKWTVVEGHPFWELRAGNDEGRAVAYLMALIRKSPRVRVSSVGIGSTVRDLALLSAVDHAIVLPRPDGEFDAELLRRLRQYTQGEAAGPEGWSRAVLSVLELA